MRLLLILCLIFFAVGCQSPGPKPGSTPAQHQAHDKQGDVHEEHDDHGDEPKAHEDRGHDDDGDEHGGEHSEDRVLKLSQAQEKELRISTTPVIASAGKSTGIRPGRIAADPDQQAVVSSQVSGTVQTIYAQVGSDITAGSLVAVISSPEVTDLQAEFHEAEVEADLASKELANKKALFAVGDEIHRPGETAKLELSQAQAKRDGAKAHLKSAVLKNERLETLLKEGIASRQQVEESRAERSALEADLAQSEAALKIAKEHLAREQRILKSGLAVKAETFPAQARLARASEKMRHAQERLQQLGASPQGHSGLIRLNSPISGTVVERDISRGELVSPGTKIAVVIDNQNLWAWVELQPDDLQVIDKGDPIELSLADKPEETVKGYLDFVSPQKDEKTQTIKARVKLKNAPKEYRLGSFVNAKISNGSAELSPAVPQKAIQFVEGQTVVYTREKVGFKRVLVELGPPISDELVSVSGLSVGRQVVVKGAEQLKSLDLSDKIGGHSH